jgi:hypothetical protein
MRQPIELRGAGTHLVMPRALHAVRLASRHSDRLSASTYGGAERCPQLSLLIELQLRLCTHRYSRVRKLAQEGYACALSHHPWLARPHLLPIVSNLHAPFTPAHAVKATAFLLGHPAVAPRVASDPVLFSAVLAALAKSRDHGLPSVALRLRQAHAELLRHIRPPTPFEMGPVKIGTGRGGAAGQTFETSTGRGGMAMCENLNPPPSTAGSQRVTDNQSKSRTFR